MWETGGTVRESGEIIVGVASEKARNEVLSKMEHFAAGYRSYIALLYVAVMACFYYVLKKVESANITNDFISHY